MKIHISRSTISEIDNLRNKYLDSLFESQELYLELFVRKSEFYLILQDEDTAGYCAVFKKSTLTEFYITDEYVPQNEVIFNAVKSEFRIKKALCKSFNHLLLGCCLKNFKTIEILGYHFRDYIEKEHDFSGFDISHRPGIPDDFQTIAKINEEVFEEENEIREYLETGRVFMYYHGAIFIGFGIFSVVVPGRPEHDIGMLVHPDHRRTGYGVYIIHHLRHYCMSKGWKPTCGCAVDNIASIKTLEKAGYISKYVMLEILF